MNKFKIGKNGFRKDCVIVGATIYLKYKYGRTARRHELNIFLYQGKRKLEIDLGCGKNDRK